MPATGAEGGRGNCAWYEVWHPKCIDCGRFTKVPPYLSVRDGAANPVCFDHANPRERLLFKKWINGEIDSACENYLGEIKI